MSKRIAFTFDERSLETLNRMTVEGNFGSLANTVRESLQVSRTLQQQAKQGYTEVLLRNPDTGKERVVVIPYLTSLNGHDSP